MKLSSPCPLSHALSEYCSKMSYSVSLEHEEQSSLYFIQANGQTER